ncbi:MAG: hypothetical protein Q8911_00465 [Bacillota bacterium]|nr:hypothetical protein [Bacillota bacterium]
MAVKGDGSKKERVKKDTAKNPVEQTETPLKQDKKPRIKPSELPTLDAVRQELGRRSCQYFTEKFVKIEDRDSAELAVPFTLWPGQIQALETFLNNRLNIVLKARQLGLTWLALAYSVWKMIHQPGYAVVAMSKREEDSKELSRRVGFILKYLPATMIREKKTAGKWNGPTWEATTLVVTINHPGKEPSVFNSLTAAQDSGRSLTASLVILDEWAFQQWAREIWAAAYPTINRPTGGQVIGLSTAKRMTLYEEIWRKATQGVNTFARVFLPWSTDPRRTEEWYEQTRKDLGEQKTKEEYPNTPEEAFSAAEGVAFPEFSYDLHVVKPFDIPAHWRKWRSADNGYTDPFAWYWYAVDEFGTVYVYREYTRDPKEPKVSYSDQARQVTLKTGNEHIGFTVVGHDAWAVNPLTRSNNTPQGKSIIDFYIEGGVKDCIRAVTDRIFRKATIHEYLKPYFDENAEVMTSKVKIFSTCEKLVETLPQMLIDDRDPEKYQENDIDHWVDSFGYGIISHHSNKTMLEERKVNYDKLPEDIIEDLERADPKMREYILSKVGR